MVSIYIKSSFPIHNIAYRDFFGKYVIIKHEFEDEDCKFIGVHDTYEAARLAAEVLVSAHSAEHWELKTVE